MSGDDEERRKFEELTRRLMSTPYEEIPPEVKRLLALWDADPDALRAHVEKMVLNAGDMPGLPEDTLKRP